MGVFYDDRGNYGREKYGGIHPKLPVFPGIILSLTSGSQNFCRILRQFTRFFLSQMHLPALLINDDI